MVTWRQVRYLLTERLVELRTEPYDDNPAVVAQLGTLLIVQELLESLPGKKAASLVAQPIKHPPAVREAGSIPRWEIPWRREMATTPSTLASRIHGQKGCRDYSHMQIKERFCENAAILL